MVRIQNGGNNFYRSKIFILQWLVKRAIETREEMGDYIRSYSISQFSKSHKMPEVGVKQDFLFGPGIVFYIYC